jgi:uncharacterized delta-60 repeat protein
MVRTRRPGTALAFLVATQTTASHLIHAAGPLDAGFGLDGRVVTDASGRYDEAHAIALEPDGQIVVAGGAGTGSGRDFVVARYNPDGTLDRSFGDAGTVVTDVSGASDLALAVAVQPDGRIVVAGEAGGDFGVVRYTAGGSLDSQFGSGGKARTDFDGDDRANALAVQRDGRIVAAGTAGGIDFALARYRGDGALDTTFGAEGRVVTDFSGGTDAAFAIGLVPDGTIVAAGVAGTFPTGRFAVARYDARGALDAGFGGDGRLAVGFGRHCRAQVLAIQPSEKIVVGGFVDNGSSRDAALIRLDRDGGTDVSFGAGGRLLTDFGGRNFATALTLDPDDRIIVGGFDDFPPYYDFALARYVGDGRMDVEFSLDGTVRTEFGGNSWINAVAVQADGKVVAAGYARTPSGADFALVRYATRR